jgi:thiol:disulfide interchange protein DsbD
MKTKLLPHFWLRWMTSLMVSLLIAGPGFAADDFLSVEEAFKIGVAPSSSGDAVLLNFTIAPRTHLYRDRLSFKGVPDGVKLGAPVLPQGKRQFDETFGKDVEVYYDQLAVSVPVTAGSGKAAIVQVNYQGCADDGLCYPPQTRYWKMTLGEGGKVASIEAIPSDDADAAVAALKAAAPAPVAAAIPALAVGTEAAAKSADASSKGSSIENALASGSMFKIVGVFFIAGLLLSFTPCVLPMVPILSSIIVGEGQDVSRLRGFTLALSYSQGMAVVYTALGVAAGLLGEGLAAYLQTPAVLGTFGVLLVLFSLSMFGAYELQMPSFIQGHLSQKSGQLKGGSLIGVFVMGLVSALIVGPCVTGPLAGALVYISQTRDVVIGGSALYALAWGMSMPLLLVGVSAGALLPRTGMWMESVKTVFGMLMLAVAWWLVSPVLPPVALLGLLGVWFALGGSFLGAFDTIGPQASIRHRAAKGMGAVLMVLGVFQLVGAFTGATSPWAPLSEMRPVIASANAATAGKVASNASGKGEQALPFKKVNGPEELKAALAEASAQGKIAMVDFYADWCVACKEMEHLTFKDERVRQWMSKASLIQADVTEVNADTKALLKQFGLFGPPGIVFFDQKGAELSQSRVIGFQKAEEFVRSLMSVLS